MSARITLPPIQLDHNNNASPDNIDPNTRPVSLTPSAPIAIPIPLSIAIPQSSFRTPSSSPPSNRLPLGSPHSLGRRRLDCFHIICLIGRGGFGKVFLVRHKATCQVYAMKVMDKDSLVQKKAVGDAHSERNILAMLGEHSTPFVIRLHIAFQTKRRIYLVMDFASGGELMFHLRKEYLLGEEDCKFYAAQLLIALKSLHAKHIIHRDIKPENVLVDAEGHLVLTDFGLAKQLEAFDDEDGENHSWCGSEDYMAPEIIARKKHTGIPADYWAFGVFIFDCLCGHPPFSFPKEKGKTNRKQLFNRILKMKPKLPQFLSSEAHHLLKRLLTRDISKRLTDAEEIQNHAWFASVNWTALAQKKVTPPFIPPASSPTACFSPSLTKSNYSAPHSPLDSTNNSTSQLALNGSKKADTNTNNSSGNVWQGFSFVAPGMEVHFELAPPAVVDNKKISAAAVATPIVMAASPEVESFLAKSITDMGVGEHCNDSLNELQAAEDELLEAELAEFTEEAKEAVEIFEN